MATGKGSHANFAFRIGTCFTVRAAVLLLNGCSSYNGLISVTHCALSQVTASSKNFHSAFPHGELARTRVPQMWEPGAIVAKLCTIQTKHHSSQVMTLHIFAKNLETGNKCPSTNSKNAEVAAIFIRAYFYLVHKNVKLDHQLTHRNVPFTCRILLDFSARRRLPHSEGILPITDQVIVFRS